jgi:hypothetical protein
MRCPVCESDRIIILVHSLRALCAECLWQWSPEIPVSKVLGAAELAEALYTEAQPVEPAQTVEPEELA